MCLLCWEQTEKAGRGPGQNQGDHLGNYKENPGEYSAVLHQVVAVVVVKNNLVWEIF